MNYPFNASYMPQIYLVHVLSRVQGIRTPQDFARLLYSSRYSTLFGFEGQESLWLATAEEAFTCYKDQPELTAELLTKLVFLFKYFLRS